MLSTRKYEYVNIYIYIEVCKPRYTKEPALGISNAMPSACTSSKIKTAKTLSAATHMRPGGAKCYLFMLPSEKKGANFLMAFSRSVLFSRPETKSISTFRKQLCAC